MATSTKAKKTPKAKASKTVKTTAKTVFKYFAPDANEVFLAGTFNGWLDKDLLLKKDKTGHWKISLPLGNGRYEYRFIVDGNWTNAQDQTECVPNDHGSWNSVLQIQN